MPTLAMKPTLVAGALMLAAASFTALPALARGGGGGGMGGGVGAGVGAPGIGAGVSGGVGVHSGTGSMSGGVRTQGNVAAAPDNDRDSSSADMHSQSGVHSQSSVHSNAGGTLRGLNRADEAAGAHGDIGRDRAEQNRLNH